MNYKVINLDMDGTLCGTYDVPNWLDKLRAYDAAPYADAAPLVRMSTLAYYLNKARRMGYKVNIISWLSKEPNPTYDEAVTQAKIDWLKRHLPSVDFDNIFIVSYGTPKASLASGILFDDERPNRENWNKANDSNVAFDAAALLEILHDLTAA